MSDPIDRNHGETEASAKLDRMKARSEAAVMMFDKAAQGHVYGGVEIASIKFKLPGVFMAESMAIITGVDGDGTPVVAFHTSVSFMELFVGLAARMGNGTLKWRLDEYRSGQDQGSMG